mmetsp:Transcript_10567/g.11994  ORF Transcript_10567/g.11994 Transcript_10567/m.11994 type:complete len:82 (+) Transcript_10567:7-252(+)
MTATTTFEKLLMASRILYLVASYDGNHNDNDDDNNSNITNTAGSSTNTSNNYNKEKMIELRGIIAQSEKSKLRFGGYYSKY